MVWREEAAQSRRAVASGEGYWARPVPGFGDPDARLVLVGLAPAAHGGNRTGRMFTGDRSGDFLFSALHRAGFASMPESTGPDDGLRLSGAYVTAAVRCAPPANRPLPEERDRCAAFLAEELEILSGARVLLALGAFALDALWRLPLVSMGAPCRRPRFAHGAELALAPGGPGQRRRTLVCSYHPSQRNVFTGLLTQEMFDTLMVRVRALADR